jgi:prevent-host-death family protein
MKVTAAEVGRNFGQFADNALVEPVTITKYGREHLVLLSADEYRRLKRRDRRAWGTHNAPADMIEAVRNAKMDERHAHLDDLIKDWVE